MRWYALHVHSNCEKVVADTLNRLGIEQFSPERLAPNQGKIVPIDARRKRPLFPGYAFLRFPILGIEALELIAGIWGYVRTCEGHVARVGAGQVDALIARLGPQGLATLPLAERWALGAMVRFKDRRNSMADLCGWYGGRAKAPGRVVVEYDLLGRRVPVEVMESELIAA